MISICALRSAACPLWVISGHTDKSAPCPREGRGVSVRFTASHRDRRALFQPVFARSRDSAGCNPHCHANISSIRAGSPQGNCSKRRRACQRRKRCAGVMARLKTGGRPLLVLFRWGFVISVGQIVVISRSEPPQRSRESKAVSEGVPPRACPCDIITR